MRDGQQHDGQPEADHPTSLDDVERLGATRFGKAVARVILLLADGKRVSIDLPEPGEEVGPKTSLSPRQRKILNVLTASPVPLSRKVLAIKVTGGDPKGRFGTDVRLLVGEGFVYESGGLLTDDVSKFQTPD